MSLIVMMRECGVVCGVCEWDFYKLEMTAKVKSVVVLEPPMSGVLTAPLKMVFETALAILLA
jgi:hypothetical protein